MARAKLLTAAAGVGAAATAAIVVQRRHSSRVAQDPERAILEQPLDGRAMTIHSADGTELHVELFGRDSGQTLLLIPGWTEAISLWTYVIRELRDEFRIVSYDLRGHGQSGPATDSDYSLQRFGEDVEAVLEAVLPDGERAVVAGHSLGGMSIAAWAEHHDVNVHGSAAALLFTGFGELIAGQLLVQVPRFASALSDPVARRLFLGAKGPLPRFSTPISSALVRFSAFGPSASPAQVAFYEKMLVACPADVRGAVGLAMADMDLHDALERLTIPTFVMCGTNDRLTPASHANRVAEALPEPAGLVELPDTGHMGPLERPREVSSALRKLAAKVAGNRPAPV
jgi:pimeloyl-ACP methyl ester carboxylesterase